MNYKIIIFTIFIFTSCKNDLHTTKDSSAIDHHKTTTNIIIDSLDINIFNTIIQYANKNNLADKTMPEIEIAIAKYFLDTPYLAKTLEINSEESLVVNLRKFDCTTYLENVISLSKCIKSKKTEIKDFTDILTKLRYKNGKINKYPSRLHYFTGWLLDNEKKQLISIVSNTFADDDFDAKVDFMSTHPQYYKQLKNEYLLAQIKETEKDISKAKLKFIPKEKIHLYEKYIKNGDIIAISTTIKGLDIAHVGIAYFPDDRLHLIHASSSQNKVTISQEPLEDYLKNFKKKNGILVARLR